MEMEQLYTALRNADASGDKEGAAKLAAYIQSVQVEKSAQPQHQIKEPSFGDKLSRQAGLTLRAGAEGLANLAGIATNPITALANMAGANLRPVGQATSEALTRAGVPTAQTEREKVIQAAAQGVAGGGGLIGAGRVLAGAAKPAISAIGETLASQPIQQLAGAAGAGAGAEFASQKGAGTIGQLAAGLVGGVVGAGASLGAAAIAQRSAPAIKSVGRQIQQKAAPQDAMSMGGALSSIGASGATRGAQRIVTAESMPVPFEGKSGLTKGQASRDFSQLQFEKESAKLGDVGAPLRERVENQTATMLQNFDALIDKPGPIHVEPRDIGVAVDRALVNKANVIKNKINAAYTKAREAGELAAPVNMDTLANTFNELASYEGVAKNISAAKREAQRLGALDVDESGNIVPSKMTINDAEILRQFVNDSTDWMDKREALMARKINASIDSATEEAGGQLYRDARKLRAQFADEFENVGLTAKLLGTKGKTNERQIALEDVFNKIIILSPTDEMNKIRGTLIKAGPEGKQAWADLKSKGIDYIKQSALSASQKDSAGNPLLSPDKLNRIINTLDAEGKLDSLYGKRQAQTLRDLAELSSVIYTAPPGAINTSNTASALVVALDSLGGFAATGMPLPVVTTLKESSKYLKNRKLKARISDALNQGSNK